MPSFIASAGLARESLTELRCHMLGELTAHALRHAVVTEASRLVIREGLPRRDFGLKAGWRTPPLQAGLMHHFISARLEVAAALFYWVVLRSADLAVGQIEFCAGDLPLAIFRLEPLYSTPATVPGLSGSFWAGLFTDPIIYGPYQHIRILVGARRNCPEGEHLSLGSLIAEPAPPRFRLALTPAPKPLHQLPHAEEVAWQELALELGEGAADILRQGGAYIFRGSNGHHYAVDGSGTLFNLTRGRQYCVMLDKDEELPRGDVILAKVRWCSKDAEYVEVVRNEVGGLDLLRDMPLYYGPGTEERQHADRHPAIHEAIWRGVQAWVRFRLKNRGWRQ